MKGVTKTIKNETKEQRGGFLSMLLGTLAASLLGNLLSGKGTVIISTEKSWRRNCKSWLWFFNQKKALIPPHL